MDCDSSDEEPLSILRRRRLSRRITLDNDSVQASGNTNAIAPSQKQYKHTSIMANMARNNTTPPDTPCFPNANETMQSTHFIQQTIGSDFNGTSKPCQILPPRSPRVPRPSDELLKLWPDNSLTGAIKDLYSRTQRLENEGQSGDGHALQELLMQQFHELQQSLNDQKEEARLNAKSINYLTEKVRELQKSNEELQKSSEEKDQAIRALQFQMGQMGAKVENSVDSIKTATQETAKGLFDRLKSDLASVKLDIKEVKSARGKSLGGAKQVETATPSKKKGAAKSPTGSGFSPVDLRPPATPVSTVPRKRAASPETEQPSKKFSVSDPPTTGLVVKLALKSPAATPTPVNVADTGPQSSPGADSARKPHDTEASQAPNTSPEIRQKKILKTTKPKVPFMLPVTHPETKSPTTSKNPKSPESVRPHRKGHAIKVTLSEALERNKGSSYYLEQRRYNRFVDGLD